MIATDRFVFLHLHKSGGTFVNTMLMHCFSSARQIGYHLPYRELPTALVNLPVVGTVRSPWDYYVSWYHFQRSQAEPNLLFRICSNDGELGFSQTVENLVELSTDQRRLSLLEEGVPETFTDHGLNLTKECVRQLGTAQIGFYSFLYNRLYAGADNPTIVRMERLRRGIREALASLDCLPNECAERFLQQAPSVNASEHDSSGAYFDDDLAELVRKRDRELIDLYGYTLRKN